MAPATVSVLKGHPTLQPLLKLSHREKGEGSFPTARERGPKFSGFGDEPRSDLPGSLATFFGPAGREALQIPLLTLALQRMVLPDLELEALLTLVRRLALEVVRDHPSVVDGFTNSDAPHPLPPISFLAALAHQCFLNGYVFATSKREDELVGALKADMEKESLDEGPFSGIQVALLACYVPMWKWENGPEVAGWIEASEQTLLSGLVRRQLLEPEEEEALRARVSRRGQILDQVSREVQAHYEENPYPRWISVDREEPRSVAEVLGGLFPGLDPIGQHALENPRILVAGCGTGQHLLQLHHRFRGARIHGIDLSRSSLAFAWRKIREAGATSITLEQADILALAEWPERFDIVESVGVLQHLADPVSGWRVLRNLLRPWGLLKIGVYSALARRCVAEARQFLEEKGYGSSAAGIREARQALTRRVRDPEKTDLFSRRDFFSMQECRDLLFHSHEHAFTLPEIREILQALDLEFLGFEFDHPTPRVAFLEEHPTVGAERDLDAWHRFEIQHPETFKNLYRLWLRPVSVAQ